MDIKRDYRGISVSNLESLFSLLLRGLDKDGLKYSQRRLGLQSGHQVGLQGGPQGVLHGVLYRVKSFQMDSGRGNMGQEWSGVVSAEV